MRELPPSLQPGWPLNGGIMGGSTIHQEGGSWTTAMGVPCARACWIGPWLRPAPDIKPPGCSRRKHQATCGIYPGTQAGVRSRPGRPHLDGPALRTVAPPL